MNPTRREWLKNLAALAALPALARCSAAGPESANDSPIIDTHQHLWDLSKFTLPWLENAPPIYRQSYRPQEYALATKGLNISSIYMEVDVAPEKRPAEAEYVVDLCKAKSGAMRAAVIGGMPDAAGFEDYIKRYQASGFVRGVRQVLHGGLPRGACLGDGFVKGIRLLGKLGLSFDLCMRPAELRDGLKLAELTPDTRFVLDHCGNADVSAFLPGADEKATQAGNAWKRDMEALGKRTNIICKISGIVAGAPEKWTPGMLAPIVNHCLDSFGPDRVVFGGDWPVCLKRAKLREWIDALREITAKRPHPERDKLWFQNASAFYKLDTGK